MVGADVRRDWRPLPRASPWASDREPFRLAMELAGKRVLDDQGAFGSAGAGDGALGAMGG
jgi:hypothetical protein